MKASIEDSGWAFGIRYSPAIEGFIWVLRAEKKRLVILQTNCQPFNHDNIVRSVAPQFNQNVA
jgi:hypothetical protein